MKTRAARFPHTQYGRKVRVIFGTSHLRGAMLNNRLYRRRKVVWVRA